MLHVRLCVETIKFSNIVAVQKDYTYLIVNKV